MKKGNKLLIIGILLMSIFTYSCKLRNLSVDNNNERIKISYGHSLRIPYNHIIITLFKSFEKKESYKMNIEALTGYYNDPNWDHGKSSPEDIYKTVEIEQEYYNFIENLILGIDLDKIFDENQDRMYWNEGKLEQEFGLDGTFVGIEYVSLQNNIKIRLWSPGNNEGELRKLDEVIINVFKKAELYDWFE